MKDIVSLNDGEETVLVNVHTIEYMNIAEADGHVHQIILTSGPAKAAPAYED